MDIRTRIDAFGEAIENVVDGKIAEIHIAEPCILVSYDPQKQTAVLQPTTKALVRKPDGTTEWVSKPLLLDSKVIFPSGGGVSLTFPLKAGDAIFAVMSSRSPDVWQQNGGEQQVINARMHDLSNAFCFPGARPDAEALANVSTDSTQLRSDDGQTVIDIKDGAVALKAQDTQIEATNDRAVMRKGDLLVSVTATRIDLGDGGSAVITEAGPSTKVFAMV